ncbi:thiamine phosphate synthase [Devosia sp.]|uniref:thiamine phosphate synthase n=1 Tax=Devosia sp. TaxID=1871048 RepID=UPI002EFFEF71
MAPQIFLIAPVDADAASFVASLERSRARAAFAALLLPRGSRPENAYKDFVKAVAPVAQAAGSAVLIEGEPGLVRTLGADGLHVTAGAAATRDAIAALQPANIVGVGNVHTRHDAMTLGELGADYLLFGPLTGHLDAAERALAQWWAQTMEIPSVLSDPDAGLADFDAGACEFIGLGTARLEEHA